MKKLLIILLILLIAFLLWRYCSNGRPSCERALAGKVVDKSGTAIKDALVEVGSNSVKTDKDGQFRICVDSATRYVLNVSNIEFGSASKIFYKPQSDIIITLVKATTKDVDASAVIFLRDENRTASIPLSAQITSVSSPIDTIPFVHDDKGRLIDFVAPKEINDTYEAIEQFQPPKLGATISVPAGALYDPKNPEEKIGRGVKGSISTVDTYSPDGMPGDYTMRFPDGSRGFMRTYGAAEVSFSYNGKALQLRQGQTATLSIPVDTLSIIYGEELPHSIPLLIYEPQSGEWVRDTTTIGILNDAKTFYEAKIRHFTVFNMDMEFTNPACYKMCNAATPNNVPTTATVEISVISKTKSGLLFGPTDCSGTGGCGTGETAYMISNLVANTPVGVRLFNGTNIRNSYVFIAGGAASPHDKDCSNNYAACTGPVSITWAVQPYMNGNGTMNKPILAFQKVGTDIKVSWVYISGAPPTYTNAATDYFIEWSDDDFTTTNGDGSVPLDDSSLANTKWHDSILIPINATNFPLGASPYKFRIRVGAPGGVYSESTTDCFTRNTGTISGCP